MNSLGSVMYAMCTGRSPFRASNIPGVMRRVCDDTPRPIAEINPEIPEWLVEVIGRLHEKDPSERFDSSADVASLLGEYVAHVQQPEEFSRPVALRRKDVQHPPVRLVKRLWPVAAGVVCLALLALAANLLWLEPLQPPPPPDTGVLVVSRAYA